MHNHFLSRFSHRNGTNNSFHRKGFDETDHGYYRHGGHGGRGKRYFGRGDVKYALLELLSSHPMHGYQMMKGLEEKTGGLYSPSPGSIYPTLQMLEDRELVQSEEISGKKTYSITEAGRLFLQERQAEEKPDVSQEHMAHDLQGRGIELNHELNELIKTIRQLQKEAENDPVKLARLLYFVKKVRHKLDGHFGEGTEQ
ncbi:PadR family transcriptional regulator [Brevibacillus sp. NRS-1366]|uniref:PadR family transcriptional regulator n=1 Tax=Brevibacillus sp. NRS-1366 TaxID=3233899 RepID=UPI003D22CB45